VYQTRTQGGGGGRGGMGGSVQGMGLGEPLTSQDGVYRQM
jgi:hypothetical protein